MLKPLLKLRLAAIGAWFSGAARKKSKPKKNPAVRIVLMSLLLLYVLACFLFLFYMWFDTLAAAWAGSELAWLYYALFALAAFALMFFFSIFTAKEQLFEAKDNDLLLSLPLKPGSILLSRLAELALINLLIELTVALPVTLAWLKYGTLSAGGWLALVLVVLLLPLFSLAFSALFGWLLSLLSRRVRKKSLFSTVFSLLFLAVYFYFYSQINVLIQELAQNGGYLATKLSAARPLLWLGRAIAEGNWLYLLLSAFILLLPFVLACALLSRTFIRTVTANRGAARVEYRARAMKEASPDAALVRRELNGFLSSSSYMVNAGLGLVMLVAGAVALPFAGNRLAQLAAELPGDGTLLFCLLLAALAALISMVTISSASVSMEGGSLWIAQSLPVSAAQALRAKLKLHLLLTLPPVLLACLSLAWVSKPEGPALLACFLLPTAYACVLAQLGLIMNLRHPNLDWTSESQAVKNGVAVIFTMLLSWGLLLTTGGLVLLLSIFLPTGWALVIVAVLLLGLCRLLYGWLMKRGAAIYAYL